MTPQAISRAEATRVFARIGFLSFGGPAAQIALMHRELVEERPWLTEQQFLNALSFCMLLPGPEAMQLATYAGWRLGGVPLGLIAGLLFIIPGAIVIAVLAALYATFGNLPFAEAIFLGIKATVIVIVLQALLRISKKALTTQDRWVLAGLAFSALFFFALPFPLIVIAAGLYGYLTASWQGDTGTAPDAFHGTARTIALWLAIWILPLIALGAANPLLADIGLFFSKLAIVTFGGAYAVLAYMAQDVVTLHGWLTAGEMMDGLGLAETTPGPLILVTEFVAFLAGFKSGGTALAILAALTALWATFAPCFLWIFTGAPFIDWIATQPKIKGALQAITAAVVGVILNLSIWFALHVFFGEVTLTTAGPITLWLPTLSSLSPSVLLLTALAAANIFWRKRGIAETLAICAGAGLLIHALNLT